MIARPAAAVVTAFIVLAAAAGSGRAATPHPCLVVTGEDDALFTRNFNPFANPVDFTWGGIYEPLVVITRAGGGHEYRWLASSFRWSGDGRTLTVGVRRGVRWSDGRPFTSEDVVFTLTAGRRDRAMDQIGLTKPGNNVVAISAVAPDRVAIKLRHRDSTFVSRVLANNVEVVPEHVFARVSNVSRWRNPDPVGTGPFTVVKSFSPQGYTLGRNPHYWQNGAPHFSCLRRVVSSSIDSALLQMQHGDIDLTNNYIPNAQKAYVAHDPGHFHYFYATTTVPVGLFFDDTRYPYSLAALRKAISRAVDRRAISREAELGYAPPVDALGIGRAWPGWVDGAAAARARALARYDPAAARRMLTRAGFTYAGGELRDPRGNPVTLEGTVIAGWTDWMSAWQILTRDLEAIGIKVDLHAVPSWGYWQPAAFTTKTATLLWNNYGDSPTPYDYFHQHLDRSAFVKSGADADRTGNWEHFWSPEGTRLLRAFRQTFDRRVQHRVARRLEDLWLRTLPYVPLFVAPSWSTYSTKYFTGFPSGDDYYLQPSFFTPAYAVALTRIRPTG